nr:tol-Pal system protein TolA-like [Aegilops tauschii subsp. strangulata]
MPTEEEEIRRREEALALEAVERSLELEQLEVRERQVAQAEDAIGVCEAKAQEEVDRRVAEARADIEGRYDLRLKLAGTEDAGRSAALRPKLAEVERREEATAAALAKAQAELASACTELLSLHRRVDDAESVARQSREEVFQRWTLEREHAPMLPDLRVRANTALGHVCDENALYPHSNDYASHLCFFADVVTCLEARAFASKDDATVVAADEGDVVDDGDAGVDEGGGGADDDDSDANGASEDDVEDAASDISG